ncbi:MAG: hypothetical protein HUU54_02340 [Ignavibacteriaceae bacterium]|nr:hypothetical protein [Ignavibacteriaceae bacterium]
MILETLDVKKNDIFVYSINKFDLFNNFFLINKDTSVKKAIPIHYNEVCRYVLDGKPKSLIAYRLLTNFDGFNVALVKYGLIVNVNGQKEVIYFDPVYALRELQDYGDLEFVPDLRFKVQQIGLLSTLRSFGEVNYTETYAFDLEANEVLNINDRVYAELIFVFDETILDNDPGTPSFGPVDRSMQMRRMVKITAEDLDSNVAEVREKMTRDIRKQTATGVVEDHPFFKGELLKPSSEPVKPEEKSTTLPGSFARVTKEEPKPTFSDFLRKAKKERSESGVQSERKELNMVDLFKSSENIKDLVIDRESKQVVLKFRNR